MSTYPTRDQAWALLTEYTKTDALRKHALAVESVMRHFAARAGEDPEVWGLVGLVHDLDYEMYPSEHCHRSPVILRESGWPEELVRAVVSHGWGICTDAEPRSELEKTLYTIDELTGLVVTTALVRPSRSLMDLEASSVRKKWKDKRFAAGVSREVIEKGAEMLGMPLNDVIQNTILGMREIAGELGLK